MNKVKYRRAIYDSDTMCMSLVIDLMYGRKLYILDLEDGNHQAIIASSYEKALGISTKYMKENYWDIGYYLWDEDAFDNDELNLIFKTLIAEYGVNELKCGAILKFDYTHPDYDLYDVSYEEIINGTTSK